MSLLLVLTVLWGGVTPASAMQSAVPQFEKRLYGDFASSCNYPINCSDPLGLQELTERERQLLDTARNTLGVVGGIIGTGLGAAGGGAGGGLVGSLAGPGGTVTGTITGTVAGATEGCNLVVKSGQCNVNSLSVFCG